MLMLEENDLEAVVSPCCAICCEEFKINDEVKQIIIGKLVQFEDISFGFGNEKKFCIQRGKVADIHTKCEK